MKRLILAAIFPLIAFNTFAQEAYSIRKTEENIVIDGLISEQTWRTAQTAGNFIQHYPYDTCNAATKTFFKLAHDDQRLYAAIICINRNPDKPFVVQSLKRDFSITQSDAVVLSLSPFTDGQNGFSFGVTPQNAQREGAIENGGNFGVSTAWDQIWYSATRITRDTWFAEFEIPFKSLRFPNNLKTWKFNVARADFRNNEVSTWIKVPRNFNISGLIFTKELNWTDAPKRKGPNIALIPYMSSLASGERGEFFSKNTPRTGLDAKIGLSSSLNLDLTINPDFAQVEVDEQQINLTRFSLFFPERRQFFIENSDLFSQFGFRQIRPFFSRRIGLSSEGNVPVDAGIRVTGKLSKDLRVGLMNVQTRQMSLWNMPGQNFTVAAFQRKVFSASNIGGILVNQWNTNGNQNSRSVAGLEYNLLTKDNKWVGKAFVQKAIYKGLRADAGYAHASYLFRRTLDWELMWNHEYVSSYFRAPTGFVPRIENYDPVLRLTQYMAYGRLEPMVTRIWYPKSKLVNKYSMSLYNSSYLDSNYNPTETYTSATAKVSFQNSAEIRMTVADEYFDLFVPFSPIASKGNYLLGKYKFQEGTIGFTSNNRKPVNGSVDLGTGRFFGGSRSTIRTNIQFRYQPRLLINLNYTLAAIEIPNLGKSNVQLLGLRTEYSLSTIMYLTAFLQYNTQLENMNINIRYQWRFRPMSDFFIVYSENYDQLLLSKNRSLAFKFVYWFNT
jgi:hypothetical protein